MALTARVEQLGPLQAQAGASGRHGLPAPSPVGTEGGVQGRMEGEGKDQERVSQRQGLKLRNYRKPEARQVCCGAWTAGGPRLGEYRRGQPRAMTF